MLKLNPFGGKYLKITVFWDVLLCSKIEVTDILEDCMPPPSGPEIKLMKQTA
jgi:hypothetical protein